MSGHPFQTTGRESFKYKGEDNKDNDNEYKDNQDNDNNDNDNKDNIIRQRKNKFYFEDLF